MNVDNDNVTAPNWLKELEEKRERKLKTRLGHETGAGSLCLECKDKCPGLDLHFWRKICKNCKCGKENHDVQDDDAHDLVQFQLLGSKPKKSTKIVLPGNNDAIDLEWTPKGSKEAVEMYLKDLPPELLPIKGSSAAQERKQLLQKQIPIHDVDPTLCHALTEDELRQMNEYINHLKEKSVGVGQLMNINNNAMHSLTKQHRAVDAQLVSNKLINQIGGVDEETMRMHPSSLSKNLENLHLNANKLIDNEPIYANTQKQAKNSKHDYENIDAFGKHKLASSLEEIKRQQQNDPFVLGEVLDKYGNPLRAQYAMLLDKSTLPIKDGNGSPIKAYLDLFGNPIFDQSLVERIGPLAKAEYAMLLDKNGAPLLNAHGNPINKPIANQAITKFFDNFGNEIIPDCAVLLDRQGQTIKNKFGGPLHLKLDIFNTPIIERALSDLVAMEQPKYVCYLEKNGALVVDANGAPIKHKFKEEDDELKAKYALLLDEDHRPLKCHFGKPITALLDKLASPILDDLIVDKLAGAIPQYAMHLDKNMQPLLDYNQCPIEECLHTIKEPIYDKFGNEIKPKFGLLLDKNESPIKSNRNGSPIKVEIDVFGRPRIDHSIIEQIDNVKPEFVMYLDSSGAPIFDKYHSPMKNVIAYRQPLVGDAADEEEAEEEKRSGVLLNANGSPLSDRNGSIIAVGMDAYGEPILDEAIIERLDGQQPHFVEYLDGNGGKRRDAFGDRINAKSALILDKFDKPLMDLTGNPITFNLDVLGRCIINKSELDRIDMQAAQYALLLDRNGKRLMDMKGNVMKEALSTNALLLDEQGRVLSDKKGNALIVPCDHNKMPLYTSEQLNGQVPDYAVPLGMQNKPFIDRYGRIVKYRTPFGIFDKFGNAVRSQSGLLLDANQVPLKDANGSPIRVRLDPHQRPIYDNNVLMQQTPKYVMLLDRNGAPILDKYNAPIKLPTMNDQLIDIQNASLLDNKGAPIINEFGVPLRLELDHLGRPMLQDVQQPIVDKNNKLIELDRTTLLGKQGMPLLDANRQPVRLKYNGNGVLELHNTGMPVYDSSEQPLTNHLYAPAMDKYGNRIDPTTGRPLPNFKAQLGENIGEHLLQPMNVNVGLINDINYDLMKIEDGGKEQVNDNQLDDYDPIPQCHKCRKVFEDNAVVIQIDRSDALWHASCFKCAGCNQSLADLVYFYHDESDDIYCGRDFAKIRGIPRCNACDELIFVKEYCLAENETYHIKHFCCFECDEPLAGQNYIIENNQPVCIKCFENLKADVCRTCAKIIGADEQGANLNGTHFHANDECFACWMCKKPLLGEKFLFRNVKLYCSGVCFNQDQ